MVLLAIHGRFLSFRFHCLLLALLCGSNMCTQISFTCYQVRNNPTITAFVCFQKFPDTFKALCLFLLSEQKGYPPGLEKMSVFRFWTDFRISEPILTNRGWSKIGPVFNDILKKKRFENFRQVAKLCKQTDLFPQIIQACIHKIPRGPVIGPAHYWNRWIRFVHTGGSIILSQRNLIRL